MDYNVIHNSEENQFQVEQEGMICEIAYIRDGNVLIITHTGVPGKLEGRGIAAAMTKRALEYAREEGLKVKPMCSYARAYMLRHPEYEDLRA